MATDYNKLLLEKGYTQQQIDQMRNTVNSGGDINKTVADINQQNAANKTSKTTTATPTTNSNTSTSSSNNTTYTNKSEYGGQGTTPPIVQPKDTSWDKGNGTYSYNDATGYYEKTGANKVTSSSTPATSSRTKVADWWNGLTPEQQQKYGNTDAGKQAMQQYGLSYKPTDTGANAGTPQGQTGNTGTTGTPKTGDGWDYQDNSDDRMFQIAQNLKNYEQTMPQLFDDWGSFYNFFIKDKGRSPDQIQFLTDYFNKVKLYGNYDNMSPEQVGSEMANGKVPDSYLNVLKYSDPARYQAVLQAKQDAENSIANESYLSTIAEQAGLSGFWKWNEKEMGFIDKNDDGLDDRLYHEPTEEERKLVDENSELEAERLRLTNAYKDLQNDLTDQYPDADLSTIMLLTSDRGTKIQRALDTLSVSQTKVQGTLAYLQNERTTMDNAGKNTIAEIQKNYGMYYEYSPQGMSELAQAQYEAMNPSLAQAENGTDTQKRMALDSILTGYYDRYGSIIQRPKEQVIADVMAYASKKGITLTQALQENFIDPLKSKPEYDTINTLSVGSPSVSFEKVGDSGYILKVNPDGTYSIESVNGSTGTNNGLYGYTNYTPVSAQEKEDTLNEFASSHPVNSDGGQCGSFVNDYLQGLGLDRLFTDPIDKKKAIMNSDSATVGSVAVMDSKKYPQYGHTAIVTEVDGDRVKLLESNWGGDEKVHERWVNKSDIIGYFDPSKSTQGGTADALNSKFAGNPDWNNNGYFNSLAKQLEKFLKDGKLDMTDAKYGDLKKSYGINDQEFNQMAINYANSELKTTGGNQASRALESAMKAYEYLYGNKADTDAFWNGIAGDGDSWAARNTLGYLPTTSIGKGKTEFDTMLNRLTLKELFDAKALGATFGAMSKDERDVLENAATDVKWGSGNFTENLQDLIEALYDASLDGKATMPKGWEDSAAWKMVQERKSGNTQSSANGETSGAPFNTPTYLQGKTTSGAGNTVEIEDWDAIMARL